MHAAQKTEDFQPYFYVVQGTYVDLLRGMEEALRRWDEIDPVRALEIVAYFHEGIEAQERHGVRLFTPATSDVAAEHLATMLAAVDIIKRADASGYDARGILAQLRPQLRGMVAREIQRRREQLERERRKKTLLGRLLGR